jgi:DHA2 family multidrug resistance protein-like MFS transporter
MICSSVNLFFTSNLLLHGIGLQSQPLLKSGGTSALVALLPFANWGERVTYRKIYLGGALLWGASSALACFSDSLPLLVFSRALQGLGAAGIMAVNMALVRLTWPPVLLGRGIALNSMVVSSATVIGPVLAAAILSTGSWRWLFALNLPVSLLLLFLGYRTLPRNTPATHQSFPSALDIALNASLFILFFLAADSLGRSIHSSGNQKDVWVQGTVLLAAATAVAVVHLRRQNEKSTGLLPLDLLRIPMFRLSMMTSVASFSAQTIAFIVLPFLMLDVWRTKEAEVGWLMSCWPIGTIISASLVGRWIGRCHGGWLGGSGMGFLSLGLAGMAYAAATSSHAGIVSLCLGLCGIGFGLFQSPNNHTIITSAPSQRAGVASGMIGTARLTGQILGAILVAILFSIYGEKSSFGLGLALGMASILSLLAGFSSLMRLQFK